LITGTIGAPATGFTSSLSASNLLNVFLFRPDLNLGATIQDLQQKNVMQILAEPNLMARSGESAKFLAGGEFPFPVVQGGTGSYSAVTIQFKPYGVKLDFTGTIDGDVIRLKLAPEVSTLDFTNAVMISGFEIPAISTRRAETQIELRNGQSFGIAGLLDRRTTVQLSKMPGIGDIPILGELFKSKSFNRTNTELLVMVTPTIVDPVTENPAAPQTPTMTFPNLNNKAFDASVRSKSDTAATTTNGNK
jgi:pilus assembly protein CpaC